MIYVIFPLINSPDQQNSPLIAKCLTPRRYVFEALLPIYPLILHNPLLPNYTSFATLLRSSLCIRILQLPPAGLNISLRFLPWGERGYNRRGGARGGVILRLSRRRREFINAANHFKTSFSFAPADNKWLIVRLGAVVLSTS